MIYYLLDSIHVAVTRMMTENGVADRFITDLRESVDAIMKREDKKMGKVAQMYCSSATMTDKSIIDDVARMYLDAYYNTTDKIVTLTASE